MCFGTFFSLLLRHAFSFCTEVVHLQTRADGKHFNTAHLRPQSKVKFLLLRELLFVAGAVLMACSKEDLQQLAIAPR